MSKEAESFLRCALEAKQMALRHEAEMRALMLSISEAYELLAHVQDTLDDPSRVYAPPESKR